MTQQSAHLRSLGQYRAVAHMLVEQVKLQLRRGDTARAAELSDTLDEMAQTFSKSEGYLSIIPALAALARGYVQRVDAPEKALAAFDTMRAHGVAYKRGLEITLTDLLTATVL
ncbi:MAG TPA: helix-turn-helix transcriptional regulator, partial [Cupriavidus sp.]|nr:helix-turn-helix transcriptional regulator [Cupriavidus sp.]